MKKILIMLIIIVMLINNISFAVLYNTDPKNKTGKDDKLPFTDLQVALYDADGKRQINDNGVELYNYHYAVNEIIKATKIGLIDGYVDSEGVKTFKPDAYITKAEFIKLAITLAMNRNFDFSAMPDVINNHWASRYLAVAQMQNVVEKGEYTKENLDEPITRIEMICILSKIQINMKGVDLYQEGSLPNYKDIDDLTDEEKMYLLHACSYRLVAEMDDIEVTEIRPHDNLTRGDAAIAIMRIY